MNKQELEKYKDPDNMRVTDDLHIVDLYQFTYEELERFIQSEIEAHDAAQWLPYPRNKPEKDGYYMIRDNEGKEMEFGWDGQGMLSWINYVKYFQPGSFRPLPKHYQP